MSGSILIIEAATTNRIALKVKLSGTYYDVAVAASFQEAQLALAEHVPDIILIGSPEDRSAHATITALRAKPRTAAASILAIVPPEDDTARLSVLHAGADEVLNHPVDDTLLHAQLRAMQRARDTSAELALRDRTHRTLGLAHGLSEAGQAFARPARITILCGSNFGRDPLIAEAAERSGHAVNWMSPHALLSGRFSTDDDPGPDAFVLMLDGDEDREIGLQLLPELRARTTTRHAAVIAVLGDGASDLSGMLVDLGANDLVWLRDVSVSEMTWRLERQITQKQQSDRLRNTTRDGLRAAATDALTGLYNRRYALPHLSRLIEAARDTGRSFAVMMADLDHFKAVNDAHGHAVGDDVLKVFSERLRDQLRSVDLLARIGGEEFLIAMPDTSRQSAVAVARRLCAHISAAPIPLMRPPGQIALTVSIGIAIYPASLEPAALHAAPEATAEALIAEADRALYAAKAQGRNTVELSDAAAA